MRSTRTTATMVVLMALIAVSASAAAARTITVTETATLKLKRDGTKLTGAGNAIGTLSGRLTAYLTARGIGVSGQVILIPRSGGSLTLNVAANLVSRSKSLDKFSGTISVRSGTSVYRDASGRGTATATLNRRTMIATVKVRNVRLTY